MNTILMHKESTIFATIQIFSFFTSQETKAREIRIVSKMVHLQDFLILFSLQVLLKNLDTLYKNNYWQLKKLDRKHV